ncbi:MAG TPA: hypothetical protein VKY81_04105 [Natronosporangium sp.]|nr:hypothetical protein [Natronosporangium sp.]
MPALFATTGASGDPVGTADVTAADDTLTIEAHGLFDGQVVVTADATGGADVLVDGAPYYVANATEDTFQLRPAPGAPIMAFASDGTVEVDAADAVNDAQGLRQALGGLLYKARPGTPNIGRFGARWGVLQNTSQNEVDVSGLTVTVGDLNCVISTTGSTSRGSYLCAIPSVQHELAPADGTNPRIDLLIAEVLDDHADSSGDLIPGRTRVLTGTPASSPTAPTLPDGALELAQLTVPANSASATLSYTAPYTVAAGGIVPVRDVSGLPPGVRREGMYADNAETDQLMRFSGSAWHPIATAGGYQLINRIVYTSSGSFDKTAYPGLRAVHVEVQAGGGGGGGTNATDSGEAGVSGGGGGGEYRRGLILAASLSDSTTVTVGSGGTGGSNGSNNGSAGGNSSFGSHVVAVGGGGGDSNDVGGGALIATGGNGGSGGSGGYLAITGSDGSNGFRAGGAVTGGPNGGASHLGGSQRSAGTTTGASGGTGQSFGGGGAGGYNNASQGVSRSGGNGAAGIVIVEVWG